MRMRFVTLLALAGLMTSAANASISMTPNVKDGDTISGEFTFTITVQSDSLVNSVEFYVGSDLRDSDESTPYEFKVDTLNETQGDFSVTFAAYNKGGESVKKTFKLKIDNGLDKGAAFHVSKGNDAITNSQWSTALYEARVALKIDANNNDARILMARANLGKGVLDLAEKYADDAVAAAPNDANALGVLSVVNLRKAFTAASVGGDKEEAVKRIQGSLVKAAATRKKVLDMAVDNFGTVTDANRLAYCDALIAAGRYSLVVGQLDTVLRKDLKNNDVANRLLYAEIRGGRFRQAAQLLENLRKFGSQDGYGYGLRACFEAYLGDMSGALDAEKEAILDDPTGMGVKTAQAYLALRRADTKTAGTILSALTNAEGQSPVVNYAMCALAFMTGDYETSRSHYETALLAEPADYDVLVEKGNQSLFFSLRTDLSGDDADYPKRQRALSRAFFEAALAARPESFEALTGLACVAMMDGRKDDAVKMAKAATAAGPEYAAAHWVYAAALFDTTTGADPDTAAKIGDAAKAEVKKGESLDPNSLQGRPYPNSRSAWDYFYTHGRIPCLLGPTTQG